MRLRRLLVLAALLLWLIPCRAAAQFHQETLLITASDATSAQTSALIHKPLWASGAIFILDVTADGGLALSLDMDIHWYSPTLDEDSVWTQNCPTTEATAISTIICPLTPHGVSAHYEIEKKMVTPPPQFTISVEHGNANPADYTVRVLWLRK